MTILITGATGLIGTEITKQALAKGYVVHFLTTRKAKIISTQNHKGFYWDPKSGEADETCLNGVSKVINLAGASISERWTNTYKRAIVESRVNSIQTLYKLLAENEHTITQFCSASALGIYPSSFTEKYDEEETEINKGFLGKVVQAWENEADTLEDLGIDIAKVRVGIVLSGKGGALSEMAKPIKKNIGAAIGKGKQWQSWIHLTDMARLFLHIVETDLRGIYNGVASNPVSNQELTNALAKSLGKSIFLPNVPEFAIKLVLGEMAAITLESQYLLNDKIKNTGFTFEFEQLDKALKDLF